MADENELANPAPLGLTGFGMTTVLLNLHNAGIFELDTMILAMGIFYGGIAQILAGLLEYKKGNTFGVTAFTSYGLFWLSFVFLNILPELNAWPTPVSLVSDGWYLLMWGIFTLLMFIGTLKSNRVLQFVFLSLAVLFFILATSKFLNSAIIGMIGGIEGIICGSSAIYLAMAEVINESLDKKILPIGEPSERD
ncbi:MAG: acetate uptake transporter [Candidatus Cloacimonetes bacterium]|nr:acetate uptake transporter [Candidatus Cloacimonadota bacterium]